MTPAISLLERSGVAHRVLTYDHDPGTTSLGLEAATALSLDPSLVYKTLVVALTASVGPVHAIAVLPVTGSLDLKAMATTAGAKRAAMADKTDAERLTGYVLGGISPLGQKRRLPTYVDEGAADAELIYVSGGRRGVDIELAPTDLVALTEAILAPIAAV